jgi:hypothetical protein
MEDTNTLDAETLQRLMRPLHHHQAVSKCLTDHCRIFSVDEPGPGGAYHKYQIHCDKKEGGFVVEISFQKGAVNEAADVNGIPDEALYAILIDRLEGFQVGPGKCREGDLVVLVVGRVLGRVGQPPPPRLEESLHWLQQRARIQAEFCRFAVSLYKQSGAIA